MVKSEKRIRDHCFTKFESKKKKKKTQKKISFKEFDSYLELREMYFIGHMLKHIEKFQELASRSKNNNNNKKKNRKKKKKIGN